MSKVRELENLFTQGKITRREFMAGLSALGLMAAVSPALLSKPARAATPKKGGRFVHAITGGSISDSLDPATHTSSWHINVESQLRNWLVEIDHNFQPIPELAESWESTPDAKKWIFNLRKGVEFHDGKTFDSEDVIYSFNHHRGEDTKSPARELLRAVTDIKKDGKYRVIFELDAGVADFPFIVSEYHTPIFKAGPTLTRSRPSTSPTSMHGPMRSRPARFTTWSGATAKRFTCSKRPRGSRLSP